MGCEDEALEAADASNWFGWPVLASRWIAAPIQGEDVDAGMPVPRKSSRSFHDGAAAFAWRAT
jgi:hypothetical protein